MLQGPQSAILSFQQFNLVESPHFSIETLLCSLLTYFAFIVFMLPVAYLIIGSSIVRLARLIIKLNSTDLQGRIWANHLF